MVTTAIQSATVRMLCDKCDGYELYNKREAESLNEDDIIELYGQVCKHTGLRILLYIIPKKLLLVVFLTWLFVTKYYVSHCEFVVDRWASKPMYLPKTAAWHLYNAFL